MKRNCHSIAEHHASRLLGARLLFTAAFTCVSSLVASEIPFSTDFEAPEFSPGTLVSDPDWAFDSAALTVELVDTDSVSSDDTSPGLQSLSLTGTDDLTLEAVDVATGQVRWVDFYVKPVFVDEADLSFWIGSLQSAVSAFVVDGSVGQVYAVDGDGVGGGAWVSAEVPIALSGNTSQDWVRLAYRIDYANQRWDLFIDSQLVLMDLGFLDDQFAQLNSVVLSADETTATGFDHFYAGDVSQVDIDGDGVAEMDSDNDGIADFYETANGLNVLSDDGKVDADNDSVSNVEEYFGGLLAGTADSDGDGLHDGQELRLGNDPVIADSYSLSNIPFSADFEAEVCGSIDGVNLWSVEGGTATVQSTQVATGAQAIELIAANEETPVVLSHDFDGSAHAQVWIDFQIKPVFWSMGAVPGVADFLYAPLGVFYFNQNNTVTYLSGDGNGGGIWETTSVTLDDTQWQRVTLYNDYAAQTWSLWLNGVRVAQDIGFAHSQPYFNHLAFQQGDSGPSYLDDLTANTIEPEALDNDGDTLSNAFERTNSAYGFDVEDAIDANLDVDEDGLGTAIELALGTDYNVADSDADGLIDGVEVFNGEDPITFGVYNALTNNGSGVYTWSTDFEAIESYVVGVLDGQDFWRTNATEAAVNTVSSFSGTQALALSSAGAESVVAEQILVSPESKTTVWVSFHAQLNSGELPEVTNPEGLGAFIMTRNPVGNLVVLDGVDQSWVDTGLALADATWARFDCRLDYVSKTWNLYVDYVLIQEEVSFVNPNLPVLSALQFEQDNAGDEVRIAYIDAIEISTSMPASLPYAGGIPDVWKQAIVDADLNDDITNISQVFAAADFDNDGMANDIEFLAGTDPAAVSDPLSAAARSSSSADVVITLIDRGVFGVHEGESVSRLVP